MAKKESKLSKQKLKEECGFHQVQVDLLADYVNNTIRRAYKFMDVSLMQREHLVEIALNQCGDGFRIKPFKENKFSENEQACQVITEHLEKSASRIARLPLIAEYIKQAVQNERDRVVRAVVQILEGRSTRMLKRWVARHFSSHIDLLLRHYRLSPSPSSSEQILDGPQDSAETKLFRDAVELNQALSGLYLGQYSAASEATKTLYKFLVCTVFPKVQRGARDQRDDLNIWHIKYKGVLCVKEYMETLEKPNEALAVAAVAVKVPQILATEAASKDKAGGSTDNSSMPSMRSEEEQNSAGRKRSASSSNGGQQKKSRKSGRQKHLKVHSVKMLKKDVKKYLEERKLCPDHKMWVKYVIHPENHKELDDTAEVTVRKMMCYEMAKHREMYNEFLDKVWAVRDGPDYRDPNMREPFTDAGGWYKTAVDFLNNGRETANKAFEKALREASSGAAPEEPDTLPDEVCYQTDFNLGLIDYLDGPVVQL